MNMEENLSVTLIENRVFSPPQGFIKRSKWKEAQYHALLKKAALDPIGYWAEAANELEWFKKWNVDLHWDPPHAQWFVGGKINASYNCLDRHLKDRPHKAALIWEGEPGEIAVWTYTQLHAYVERFTASLRKLGVKKGDCVAIYMPMIPEAIVAMLACARGGFTHTVIFGGFSSEALKDRIQDAQATLLITADGCFRKGNWLQLREQALVAVAQCPQVRNLITFVRSDAGKFDVNFSSEFEHKSKNAFEWQWHALIKSVKYSEQKEFGFAEPLDSEHPLFILYTSGTTGKPKGIVHTTGGYLTGVARTTSLIFDLQPEDLYWCTADIGWITGHSYLVYGPLACGASVFIYEGALTHPRPDRIWELIERLKVTILYTAPTAIRSFMKVGSDFPDSHDLSSLRLLGTVGEPINPEAWMWYYQTIGKGRCPIVDTFWQTETGAIVISPVPGVTPTKPGSATRPLPGYDVEVVDKNGKPVPYGQGGFLVIQKPWPSMARTIHNDPQRFKRQYWSEFPNNIYFTGDGAHKDEQGYIWCLGRVDDVLNVSGHRLGTMEVESALVSHPSVAEAAVVGRPDDLKGQVIVAFVTLKSQVLNDFQTDPNAISKIKDALKKHVVKEIGALARPEEIRLAESLPKTRSGKIMRRLLKELAIQGVVKGDTSTLEDFGVVSALQKDVE